MEEELGIIATTKYLWKVQNSLYKTGKAGWKSIKPIKEKQAEMFAVEGNGIHIGE